MTDDTTRMYKWIALLALAATFLFGVLVGKANAAPEDYPKEVQGKYYETERALLEDRYPKLYAPEFWKAQEYFQNQYSNCEAEGKWLGFTTSMIKSAKCFTTQRFAVRATSRWFDLSIERKFNSIAYQYITGTK